MRAQILALALFPAALSGSGDPFVWGLPDSLAPGAFEISLGARQFVREYFSDGGGRIVYQQEADGFARSLKGFRLSLDASWQYLPAQRLSLSLPYWNQEYSLHRPGQLVPNSVDDPGVRRGDGAGDASLSWRAAFFERGGTLAVFDLKANFPTGLAPFASQHPIVATGDGGFSGEARLGLAGRKEAFSGWVACALEASTGYSADISPGVFFSFKESPPYSSGLAGGRAWVSRDPSLALGGGLAYDWHKDALRRHRMALEAKLWRGSPLEIDGSPAYSESPSAFELVPQFLFEFGGFDISVGWLLPLWSSLRSVGRYGDVLLRADFRL